MPRHSRSTVLVACCALLIFASAGPSRAEPITVTATSGGVSFRPSTGTIEQGVQLYGADGFSLVATPGTGVTGPTCCLDPGATTVYRGAWSSTDLFGTVTYKGDVFDIGAVNSVNSASVAFVSSPFTLPPHDDLTSTTITAPFTLTGSFVGSLGAGLPPSPPSVSLTLVGSGTGTILFTWLSSGPVSRWEPRLVSLQVGANEAVPEPGSLLLVCLSLAGVYAATRCRLRGRLRTVPS